MILEIASKPNFTTHNCAKRFGLRRTKSNIILSGISDVNSHSSQEICCLLSWVVFPHIYLHFLVVLKLCSNIPNIVPEFNISAPILLGGVIFVSLFTAGRKFVSFDIQELLRPNLFGLIFKRRCCQKK